MFLSIGKVAAAANLRVSAIRYYEEAGLLPRAARKGDKRIFDATILDRLALIELAKGAGFTIRETATLLEGVGRTRPAKAAWRKHAQSKLAELDEQIQRATRMKSLLTMLLGCDCATLDDCGRAVNATRRSK